MLKMIVVYNTCGIKRDNADFYISSIESILRQKFDRFKIVVSSCLNSDGCRRDLAARFPFIPIICYDNVLPVNVTFNRSVQLMVQKFGPAEGYFYLDSGVNLGDDLFVLEKLYSRLATNKYGIVAAQTDTDTGFEIFFNVSRFDKDFIVPIGKTCNLHSQVYSNDYYLKYGFKLLSDVFRAFCSESINSFLVAAIQKQFVICGDVMLNHAISVDGRSAGFENPVYDDSYDQPYIIDSILNRVLHPDAVAAGLGYEEYRNILVSDKSQFDANYHCINDKLFPYMRENFFLKPHELDYNQISSYWYGGN